MTFSAVCAPFGTPEPYIPAGHFVRASVVSQQGYAGSPKTYRVKFFCGAAPFFFLSLLHRSCFSVIQCPALQRMQKMPINTLGKSLLKENRNDAPQSKNKPTTLEPNKSGLSKKQLVIMVSNESLISLMSQGKRKQADLPILQSPGPSHVPLSRALQYPVLWRQKAREMMTRWTARTLKWLVRTVWT